MRSSARTRRWRGAAGRCDAKHAQQRALERVGVRRGRRCRSARARREQREEVLGDAGALARACGARTMRSRALFDGPSGRLGDPRRAREQLLDVGEQRRARRAKLGELAPERRRMARRGSGASRSASRRSSRGRVDVVAEQHARASRSRSASSARRARRARRRRESGASAPSSSGRAASGSPLGHARRSARARSDGVDHQQHVAGRDLLARARRAPRSRCRRPAREKPISIFIASSRPSGWPASTRSPGRDVDRDHHRGRAARAPGRRVCRPKRCARPSISTRTPSVGDVVAGRGTCGRRSRQRAACASPSRSVRCGDPAVEVHAVAPGSRSRRPASA